MTRVSLKEAYDNKDVIAQIYAIRDTAESAVDTSEQAVTVANGARQHVDELVPQVEQAVVDANTASASAQASAQTVAGYENRLTVAEGAIDELESDVGTVEDNLNTVTLRVTTAEGNIVTIQGRVTALETADGQNVKINRINDYALGLTGNQENILGNKQFVGDGSLRTKTPNVYFQATSTSAHNADRGNQSYLLSLFFNDADGNRIMRVGVQELSDGKLRVYLGAFNTNNVQIIKSLGIFNYTTGVWES